MNTGFCNRLLGHVVGWNSRWVKYDPLKEIEVCINPVRDEIVSMAHNMKIYRASLAPCAPTCLCVGKVCQCEVWEGSQ